MKTKYTDKFYRKELKERIKTFKEGCIIGLDMSLTGFGVVTIKNKNGKIKEELVIKSKKRGAERLVEIRRGIIKVINHSPVKLAVIEGYAYGRNVGRFFDIGELGGVIKQSLYLKDIPYIIITPLMLKKWITGTSRGDKSVILMKILKQFDIEINDNNIGDAFVLARIGYTLNKIARGKIKVSNIYKYQEECIKTIVKKEK